MSTPRTDRAERLILDCRGETHACVNASIARQLETELNEQVLLNGKGGEREADLLGKIERLEREKAKIKAALEGILSFNLRPPEWAQHHVKKECEDAFVRAYKSIDTN